MFAVRDVITSNFAIVVAVQAIWFACVTAWTSSWAAAWRHLAVGMVVGLPTGVAFDLIIGSGGGIFRYVGVTSSASFTIINGVFSYGLAAATVLAPPSAKLPNYEGGNRRGVLAFCCCAIGVLIALTVERWHTLLLTFTLGAEVLVCGETLCLALGRRGILLQFFEQNRTPVLHLWLLSVTTGIVYEVANGIFPVWSWVDPRPNRLIHASLIVLLGYFVLFYPIYIAYSLKEALLGKEFRDRSRIL